MVNHLCRYVFIQVLKNCDELFDQTAEFSIGSLEKENDVDTSIFFCKPTQNVFDLLLGKAKSHAGKGKINQ